MATPVFFMGTAAFALLAQPPSCATAAPATPPTSSSTSQHEPGAEQHTSPLSDSSEASLQHPRRRLSTIIEENEDDAKRNANDNSGPTLSRRRVSLQKGGWTVAKGGPTSPRIDEKKQSNSIHVHISVPPTSPDLVASRKGEDVLGLMGWDQCD